MMPEHFQRRGPNERSAAQGQEWVSVEQGVWRSLWLVVWHGERLREWKFLWPHEYEIDPLLYEEGC